jgi:DNA-directed RNA polymerase specialized sigma24 family protein
MTFTVRVELSGPELSLLTDAAESRQEPVSALLRRVGLAAISKPVRVSVAAQTAEAVELWDLGWSASEIGRRLGVSRETATRRIEGAVRRSGLPMEGNKK